ncbi:MAG: two-component regulator propeller domain-containing protein [Bacteroidia bacterium]
MLNLKIFLWLALIATFLMACETGNVQPKCCQEPAGELIWETYSQGNGSLSNNQINDLIEGPEAKVWAATELGLNYWNGENWFPVGNTQQFWSGVKMYDLLLWEDSLYLASENGLHILREQWTPLLSDDTLTALAIDSDAALWTASQNAQLWRYEAAFYAVVNPSDPAYAITFVFEEDNGRLWLGAEDGQIHIRETGVWRSENLGSIPTAISQNPNGQIWIATKGSGAFLYENAQQVDQFGQNEGALSNTIYCLQFDDRNRLWLGTDKGLNVISGLDTPDDVLINFYDISDGLASNQVYSILIQSETNWWIGTDKGVSRRYIK